MIDRSATKPALWPFILVDILFLGLACLILSLAHRPLLFWEALVLLACVSFGAWSFLTPFLRQNAAALKLAESDKLAGTVAQIQNLDQIAAQLSSATNYLKDAQEQSIQTVGSAKCIADKMADESRAFSEFILKANDTEKTHLRLEVEKLRRAEGDWLQILVHILDHIFALNRAAVLSGKPAVIEQIGNFQNICRDTARRIGLVCHTPDAQSEFDEKLHQVLDGEPKAENGARLAETLANGYSYQGRVVRRALVRLQTGIANEPEMIDGKSDMVEKTVEEEPADVAQKTLL